MSDGMVIAVVVTNLALGAMTLGVVAACIYQGLKAAMHVHPTARGGRPAHA